MSDYQYQHDIFFQYTFGSTAFLVYLAVVNLADIRINWQRVTVLAAAFIVSVACFYKVVVPKAIHYPVQAVRYYNEITRKTYSGTSTFPPLFFYIATTFQAIDTRFQCDIIQVNKMQTPIKPPA